MLSMCVLPMIDPLQSIDLVLLSTLFSIYIPPKHHTNKDTSFYTFFMSSASIDKDERGAKAGTSTTKKSKSHDTKSTPSASTYNTPEARLEALLALQKGGLAGYDAQIDTGT